MSQVSVFSAPSLTGFLIFLIVFILSYDWVKRRKWDGLPPGPPCLPLLGSLPFLGADIRAPIRKMCTTYGDIFTIYIGSRRVVVLNTYQTIKEAFVKKSAAFIDRPPIFFVKDLAKCRGLVCSSGNLWQVQRQFAHRIFRDFGVGRSLLEDSVTEEVTHFLEHLSEYAHGSIPYNLRNIMQMSVSNIICSLTFGSRFDYGDARFKNYLKIVCDNLDIIGSSGILSVFPWLRHLPGDVFQYKKLQREKEFMDEEYRKFIREHRMSLDLRKPPRDLIDAYIREMDREEDDPSTTFTEEQLLQIIGDLFTAGTETTATTLLWGLLFLIHNPEVQNKLHAEIDAVLGRTQTPRISDRERMPFTEACLCEIQRLGDIVPFGVPRYTTIDVELSGYRIPKGTMVMPSLNRVFRDPDTWPEPFEFHPERFLTTDGSFRRREQLIPFSVGRRVCLGEGLARMELFLFFVSIFQRYSFTAPPGTAAPDYTGIMSITNMPKPFAVLISKRLPL